MTLVALSLGSNLDPETNLPKAVTALSRELTILAISSAYETEPVGPPGQPRYFNAAALVRTELTPFRLKRQILRPIEARLGRIRGRDRFEPRPIDLDITLWGDLIDTVDGSVIPDPELVSCIHLAVPLAEIAPDLVHPVVGETIRQIATRLAIEAIR